MPRASVITATSVTSGFLRRIRMAYFRSRFIWFVGSLVFGLWPLIGSDCSSEKLRPKDQRPNAHCLSNLFVLHQCREHSATLVIRLNRLNHFERRLFHSRVA